MKTKQDNDVTNHTSVVYIEIETKLSCLIRKNVVYHKKKLDRRMTWLIVQVWSIMKMGQDNDVIDVQVRSTPKTQLNFLDRSNMMRSIINIK